MRSRLLAVPFAWACCGAALACPLPSSYSYSVLPQMPAVTARETVVARIEIIALAPAAPGAGDSQAARVRVIEPIRGVEAGRELVVRAFERSMCVQWFGREDVGRRGYIAGVIDPASGAFRGAWRGGVRVD